MKTLVDSYLTIKFFIMRNLFNNFIKDVLQMAHEDPPGGNGGNNTGTGTGTEGNNGGSNNTEGLKNDTDEENEEGGNTGSGNNAGANSGGTIDDNKVLNPDVGVGVF
jgi:hypothetical protein